VAGFARGHCKAGSALYSLQQGKTTLNSTNNPFSVSGKSMDFIEANPVSTSEEAEHTLQVGRDNIDGHRGLVADSMADLFGKWRNFSRVPK
jgi:hypothetical protein